MICLKKIAINYDNEKIISCISNFIKNDLIKEAYERIELAKSSVLLYN